MLVDLKLMELNVQKLTGPLTVFKVSRIANPLTKKLASLISGTVPTTGCLTLNSLTG